MMTLADMFNGPEWVIWVAFAIFALLAIVLLSGRGSWLIAGYNTASKSDKEKYDEKKLCTITGSGMAVVAVLVLAMEIFQNVLPGYFAYIAGGIIILDSLVIIVLANIFARKKE